MVTEFQRLRPTARLYVTLVILAGATAIGQSVYELAAHPISNRWIILAVLTLLTGSFNLKVPSINAYISISEAFVFASILFFGTPAGTATVLVECLVITLWMKPQSRATYRVLFNLAAPSVAIWIAGTTFYLLSSIQPYSKGFTPLPTLFFPYVIFTAAYFFLNSWLVAIAVALEKQQSALQTWWTNFAWLSVNYFSGAYVAALIVTYTRQIDFSALVVIIPLLGIAYLTFRTAIGRAEDSYSHLAELNRLYLSTIETLAMAIDAKDQITHGHIRRVQTFAVGLAKSLGVSDNKLLKAIEAAALLHDMGKLAVPEHILNKPGKLTPAEFEKMKLHASVGADILSAIDFPYPVVPIVRHHHENWNGTGYPDGIKGTDIPIGARILSVVDCFDALTSDRPYRPRLSDDEAVAILIERRGSMYDPLVVDTFIRVHEQIAPAPLVSMDIRTTLRDITESTEDIGRAEPRTDGRSGPEMTIPGLVENLANPRSISEAGDAIVRHLRTFVPFSLSVLYLYDVELDQLVAAHLSGEAAYLVRDLRISRGDRLSGWVAANRQPIMNSDPTLDLGEIAKATTPPLRISLSVPLLLGSELIGVLTLYSATERFDENHRQLVETAGRHAVRSFQHNRESVVARV